MNNKGQLLNLALLESLKQINHRDELDLFIPFIALTIKELEKAPFTESDIQAKLKELFGFLPPLSAIKSILARAKKKNIVRIENHAFFPNSDQINAITDGFTKRRSELSDAITQLTSSLIDFAQEKFNKPISKVEAEEAITNFIEKNTFSIAPLAGRLKNSPEIRNKEHLIASFFAEIHKSKNPLLKDIEVVVKGVLLANYLCYADKITNKEKFKNITLYLDTPIAVALLGFSGPIKKKSTEEFLALLQAVEIKVSIYDVTLDELIRLLHAWKTDLTNCKYDKFNPKTLELLRLGSYDPPRLESEIALAESKLNKLGIEVRYGFSRNSKHQCDEKNLQQVIKERVLGPSKDPGHDTECVSRTHNTRKSKTIRSLSEEMTLFVTINTQLAKHVSEFFREEFPQGIPIVVTEQWLTTIFWLKNPDISKQLPIDQLIANVYGALNTDDHFWNSFIRRLETAHKRGDITNEDFALVRYDANLLGFVHDASIDCGDDFTAEDVFEVVERVKQSQNKKHQEELEIERDRNTSEIKTLETKLSQRENRLSKIDGYAEALADQSAKFIAYLVSLSILTTLFLASYVPFIEASTRYSPAANLLSILPAWLPIQSATIFISTLIVILINIASSIFGISLISIHRCIYIKSRAAVLAAINRVIN